MNNLIGMKELARHLDISVKALRIRVSKGTIAQPVKREGDELFWDRGDVGCKTPGESLCKQLMMMLEVGGFGAEQLGLTGDYMESDARKLADHVKNMDANKPTVVVSIDSLPTKQHQIDALISLNKDRLPRGTTMHIVKGRQSGDYKLDVSIADPSHLPGKPDPLRHLHDLNIHPSIMESGYRRGVRNQRLAKKAGNK